MDEKTSTSSISPNLLEASLALQYTPVEEEELQSSMAKRQKRKVEGDKHHDASSKRRMGSSGARLCYECAKIDLDKIINIDMNLLQRKYLEGVPIADLGTRINSAPTNRCRLCQFLYQNLQPSGSAEEQYQLCAFPHKAGNRLLGMLNGFQSKRLDDMPCLGIVPLGWRYPNPNGTESIYDSKGKLSQRGTVFCISNTRDSRSFFQPRIIHKSADLYLARKWIDYCVHRHKGCSVSGEKLDGLQLIDIDCLGVEYPSEIKEPVEAPKDAIYAALSYVWGATSDMKVYTKTVSDAIIATRQLGLRYLWVDKHCIPEDENEKDRQIKKMDIIYKGAYVTIVASAGDDANHGLPGIGNTPRDVQPMVSIGRFSLFSSMPHPHKTITESKWATRGWTFQESFLSCRRLVFTQNQLYFECKEMNCSEAMPHDYKTMDELKWRMNSGVFAVPELGPDSLRIEKYRQSIAVYCGRELTNIRDAFDAFAGVSRDFWKNGIKSFWGIGYENCDDNDHYGDDASSPSEDDNDHYDDDASSPSEDDPSPSNSASLDDDPSDDDPSDDDDSDDDDSDDVPSSSSNVSLDDLVNANDINNISILMDIPAVKAHILSEFFGEEAGNMSSMSIKAGNMSIEAGNELRRIFAATTYDNHSDDGSPCGGPSNDDLSEEDRSDHGPSTVVASFTTSLAWYHNDDSFPERRSTFVRGQVTLDIPSWSWLGWREPSPSQRVAATVIYDLEEASQTECDVKDVVLEFSETCHVSLTNEKEWPPWLRNLEERDSFLKPIALRLKGGILKPGRLQYDSRGDQGLEYNKTSEPRRILFDGRRVWWYLSNWQGSKLEKKYQMEYLCNSIKAGTIQLFLLERVGKNCHVFLVTQKIPDGEVPKCLASHDGRGSSCRIGIAWVSCYNMRKHHQIEEGVTIRLV